MAEIRLLLSQPFTNSHFLFLIITEMAGPEVLFSCQNKWHCALLVQKRKIKCSIGKDLKTTEYAFLNIPRTNKWQINHFTFLNAFRYGLPEVSVFWHVAMRNWVTSCPKFRNSTVDSFSRVGKSCDRPLESPVIGPWTWHQYNTIRPRKPNNWTKVYYQRLIRLPSPHISKNVTIKPLKTKHICFIYKELVRTAQ
jgi:hypothetical protein